MESFLVCLLAPLSPQSNFWTLQSLLTEKQRCEDTKFLQVLENPQLYEKLMLQYMGVVTCHLGFLLTNIFQWYLGM